MSIKKVYLCFGGNQGDTPKLITLAIEALAKKIGICLKVSSFYKTKPLTESGIDPNEVEPYTNAAAVFESALSPEEILQACLQVESVLGRVRDQDNRYASRTIDIDIALIEDVVIRTAELEIPHPRLHERDFMMVPLLELEAGLRHPSINLTLLELQARVSQYFINYQA